MPRETWNDTLLADELTRCDAALMQSRAEALRARQLAEAEAQDAADLAPTPEAPDAPSGWWLLPAAAGGLLFWIWLGDRAVSLIARLF